MLVGLCIDAGKPPDWLFPSRGCNFEFDVETVLRDSVYYPSCGRDGDPIRFFAGYFFSFVYVDFSVPRGELLDSFRHPHHGFRGYELLHRQDVAAAELCPTGWTPNHPDPRDGRPEQSAQFVKEPFAIWTIWARRPGFPSDHGPDRFSLLYICGDGAATFQALYHSNRCAPLVVAIIQPGHAFGGNWTDFTDPTKIFARDALNNPSGRPKYILYGGWGSNYRPCCWPDYTRLVVYLDRKQLHDTGELGLWALWND